MCIGGLITGLYLAPRWKATGNLTAAEFIRERLGERVQKSYIYIFMLVSFSSRGLYYIPCAKLVGSSLGFPLLPTTIVLGLFMIAYTASWGALGSNGNRYPAICYPHGMPSSSSCRWLSMQQAACRHSWRKHLKDSFSVMNGEYTWGFILAFAFYHIFYIGGNWTLYSATPVLTRRSPRRKSPSSLRGCI